MTRIRNNPLWDLVVLLLLIGISLVFPSLADRALPVAALIKIIQLVYAGLEYLKEGELEIDGVEVPEDLSLVDPWRYQKQLMRISAQRMPRLPTLTNDAVLYVALIMEELAETMQAVGKALHGFYGQNARVSGDTVHPGAAIARNFLQNGAELQTQSKWVRQRLHGTWIEVSLKEADAVAILDGTTDIAVVNSGFALAAGLPGAAAYEEVATSNLSKANPLTGLIDKDPSGKWLKGSAYVPPNLATVLANATP